MNPEAYVEMAATESTHWWFRGRRRILYRIIETLALPRSARILEGEHDVFLHRKRRYTARSLRYAFVESGLAIDRIIYFNMLALARLKGCLIPRNQSSGAEVPLALVNAAFRAILSSERHLITAFNLPASVSLMATVHAE